jgi:Icc-related predicted phosphoesterase
MPRCLFATDLHGHTDRYEKLFEAIPAEKAEMLFLGGDLLPHGFGIKSGFDDFFGDFLLPGFRELKKKMGEGYPEIYLILGNDDPRINEEDFIKGDRQGLWHYAHEKVFRHGDLCIIGYAYVPPTPFRLKDWERYDVSRYADPGCMHPTEGAFSVPPMGDIEYQTIREDLDRLTEGMDLSSCIMLFHSPPYRTNLDRAALDGKMIDHVPLDVNVGSIAIKRLIEERKPMLSLHGHIHESSRITGQWEEYIGETLAINAAWDGPELSLVVFDTTDPGSASRQLL